MIDENEKTEQPKQVRKGLTLKQISSSIQSAIKWQRKGPYQSDDARWKQWERNKKYLMCIWPDTTEDDVNVNTIRANYMTKRPTLYFKNPKITLTPSKPEFTRDDFGNIAPGPDGKPILVDNYIASKTGSLKLNYELKEIKFKRLMRKVTGDCLCPYGIGWAKVGYSRLTVGGHDNDRDTSYTYWIQRVDPRNIVYDWMATDMDNVRLMHERLIMTKQDAKEYGFKIPDDYVCELPDFIKDRSKSSKKEESDEDLVVIWETEDPKNEKLYWTIGGEKDGSTVVEAKPPVDNPYPFEGSAYVPLVLNDDNDDIIGLSDVEPIEDQVRAINRIRTKQTKHIEWYGTKTIYEDGAIEPSEIDKTKITNHGIYQKVNIGKLNSVREESPVAMGNDQYAMCNEHKEDIRTTLGITEFQQGSAGSASTKATTANIVQNSSNNRIEENRDIIHDFVLECVRRLWACIQQFSSEEEYLNLKDEVMDEDYIEVIKKEYGFNPKIPFLRMSKKDIQGEYNSTFNIEDMIVQPKEVQAQQFTNFLGMVFSNPLITQKFVEGFDIDKVLKKGAELNGIDLGELKKGGPISLSSEQENQMFLGGMEVPEPHAKDNDDEHILSHGRVEKELEAKLQEGQMMAQQLIQQQQALQAQQQQLASEGQAMGMDAPQVPPELQQQIDQIVQQMEPIQNVVRKIKIHKQWHDMNRQRKETSGMSIGGMGQQPQGQPAATMQANMQGQARGIG